MGIKIRRLDSQAEIPGSSRKAQLKTEYYMTMSRKGYYSETVYNINGIVTLWISLVVR
jgi:hypothetical protein